MRDPHQLAPSVAFLHLAVDQASRHLPLAYFPLSPTHLKPLSKMGRESIKVHIQAITGEERQAARSQELSQGVDDSMRRVLHAGAEMKHRKNLCAGVDCQPQPEYLLVAAQPGAQFVQLEVRELEVAERVLVQGLCVLASSRHPGGDRGMTVAEDTFRGGRIQPFGERRQHHCDLMGGGFQTVQGSVASSTERGVAGLATKGLDLLSATMCAIPN